MSNQSGPLRLYAVVHTHEYGITVYPLLARQEPSREQVEALVGHNYEPDLEESLDVAGPLAVSVLASAGAVDLVPEDDPAAFVVPARACSDDGKCEARFDAAPYLAASGDDVILALAAEGWGPGEASDEIAEALAPAVPALADLLAYVEQAARVADVGYACRLDAAAARRWVAEHRLHLAAQAA